MKINEYFESEYLTAGRTYDNFIFENCPKEFLAVAKEKLSVKDNGVKPCNVYLNREMEECFEKMLENEENDLRKKIKARDFICALITKEVLEGEDARGLLYFVATDEIEAILNGDYLKYLETRSFSLIPSDIRDFQKEIGKIELNFFLEDTKNPMLQRAINIFIASREPYSIKVFTNNERLPSYSEQNGNFIECPHDYMRRDVNCFIEKNEEPEKEL